MIYRNEVLINWKSPKTRDEIEVRDEITDIINKYFSDSTHKMVKILYPKGALKDDENDGFAVLRKFPIRLWSTNGEWRYSKARMTSKTKTNPSGFVDHHRNIRHQEVLSEKDVEFLWFLKNRSSDLNKAIFIEDVEGNAKKKVDEMATDADIKYMLMGKTSPVSKDHTLIREVAEIFGIRDVDKMQINELKLKLYDELIQGEKLQDKFINFEKFEELTEGNVTRKAAYLARVAINDGIVGYKASDRAWYLMSRNSYEEKLVELKQQEVVDREQLFINEVVTNAGLRERLMSAMGETDEVTCETLREIDRPSLQRKYKKLTGEYLNSKKEEILEKLCERMEIPYTPPA